MDFSGFFIEKDVEEIINKNSKLRKFVERIVEENRELYRMAHEDVLTGLDNRRSFEKYLEKILSLYHREVLNGKNGSVAVCHLDLISFKKVNDEFGYDHGDRILKKVADIFKETFRRGSDEIAILDRNGFGNKIFRYGGDEFGLILPETDKNGIKFLFEKLKGKIEGIKEVRISLRMGCVYLKANEIVDLNLKKEDLIELANHAIKLCKKDGKNLVILDYEYLKSYFNR